MNFWHQEDGNMIKIGILALQGSCVEHFNILSKVEGVIPLYVKTVKELDDIDGLIIPGGESTVISKLLKDFNMFDILKKKIKKGLFCYGTCAGVILLSKEIKGECRHLGLMDITVLRNAYGRQLGSFETELEVPEVSDKKIEGVFIRAPKIICTGVDVKILCEYQGSPVMARQDNMLVTTFHPELTDNLAVHKYFVKMIKDSFV